MKKAFTLIELLVVIAIIGLLSAVVLVSLNGARARARDAIRKSDLSQIEKALMLYYDKYGSYPISTEVCNPGANTYYDYWCRDKVSNEPNSADIQNWIPGLSEFMPNMPHNPKPYPSGYWPYHYYSRSGQNYWLMVGLENANDKDTCGGGAVYIWIDDGVSNRCEWWGSNLYVRMIK